MTQYFVVRCRGADTLPLMAALKERQLDGWTPRVEQRTRIPRKRKVVTLIRPAMPSFLFIAESDLDPAVRLGRRRLVPHHTPFVFNGEIMSVDGMALMPLRRIDVQGLPNDEAPPPPVGTRIVVVTGPFRDLYGTIVGHAQEYLCVCLENSQLNIKMTSFFVRPVPI